MNTNWMLWPPVAFFIVLLIVFLQACSMKLLAPKGSESEGKRKPYACGEDIYEHRIRPDYTQFFAFAFFFTVMHVVVMLMTTIPKESLVIGVFYVVIVAAGPFMLFRQLGNILKGRK